ncbi:MAG: CoA-binding protein [Geodermatophilaceae bacterium]
MADRRGSDDDISRLLSLPVWAVVGLTANRPRPSYGVARFLLDRGVRVIPVNPEGTAVHDQPGVRALSDIDQPVDVVDIFRRSAQAGAHVDEAIAIGAAAVWLQLGVVDSAAADRAESAGLTVVMDRCPTIEWPRLGPHDRA